MLLRIISSFIFFIHRTISTFVAFFFLLIYRPPTFDTRITKLLIMRIVSALITFFILTAVGCPAFSENTQTIRGQIIDQVTAFPLINANIILLESDPILGTATDLNGYFTLKNVPLGRQSFQVKYLGYKTRTISNLLVTSGKAITIEITMEEEAVEMSEFIVKSGHRKDQAQNEMALISARTFSVEETERFAGSLGDPARMVANYAGVMTQNDSRNDIIIRGNSPMGVLWRLEGVEVPNPNHFGALGTTGGPVSMVNNNLLSNSDFLTGAFPAEFGNATAGVFDLNMRSGNNQKAEYTGQIGFNGFEAGAEGPLWRSKKGINASYLANYRYSTLDMVNKMGFDVGTGSAIPEYQDFTFLVDMPGTQLGRFKLFGMYGNSHIAFGYDAEDDNSYTERGVATDFGSGLFVVGGSNTYFFNENTRLKTTLSYQSTHADAELDSIKQSGTFFSPFIRSQQTENKVSASSQFKHKVNAKNNYTIGLIQDLYGINYLDSIRDKDYNRFIKTADTDGHLSLFRSFAQWQHKFSDRLVVNGGVHTQYLNLTNEFVLEPRLGLQWQLNSRQSISAGYGKHSQLQPKVIYFMETYNEDNDSYYRTNEDVLFTKSHHYLIGYNFLAANNFRFKLEGYYQDLYHVPVSETSPEFSLINAGGDFGVPREDSLLNTGTGTNYGVEFTAEKFMSNGYYFLFTASLFDSKYKGYDGKERNTAFNGNYVFNLLGGYEHEIGKTSMLTVDLKTVWAGGKRYVPIDFKASQQQGEEVRNKARSYEIKYNDYLRADLRIGLKTNGKKITQEWALDLQNITGYKSIFTEGYDVEKGEVYKIYQQGFVPMMLYRILF